MVILTIETWLNLDREHFTIQSVAPPLATLLRTLKGTIERTGHVTILLFGSEVPSANVSQFW